MIGANGTQTLILKSYPPPPLFAVVSWGCAATSWLARALNSHRHIFCVHAANSTWSIWTGAQFSSSAEYLAALGVVGTGNLAAGDVHGVGLHDVEKLKKALPNLKVAVVVREPVRRFRSALALWNGREDQFPDQPTLNDIIVRAGEDPDHLTKRELIERHFAQLLNTVVEEQQVAPVFRCEDLTSKPETLMALVSEVTGGNVEPTMDWAQWATSQPAINRHVSADEPVRPELMDVLARYVTPEAWAAYEALGYENLPSPPGKLPPLQTESVDFRPVRPLQNASSWR